MEDGGYGLDFGVAVRERELGGDGFGEEEGAKDVVVGYVVHMLGGEGEGGGYEWGWLRLLGCGWRWSLCAFGDERSPDWVLDEYRKSDEIDLKIFMVMFLYALHCQHAAANAMALIYRC